MGRRSASNSFVTPLLQTTGVAQTPSPAGSGGLTGKGVYVLAAGTYYFPLGGQDARCVSVHLQWGSLAAGTARIEDSNLPDEVASVYADGTTDGSWVDEDPTTAFVGTVGAGASVTNGVLTITAGNRGGALWNIADTGVCRSRLKLVVTTQGAFRLSTWAKE